MFPFYYAPMESNCLQLAVVSGNQQLWGLDQSTFSDDREGWFALCFKSSDLLEDFIPGTALADHFTVKNAGETSI
jgi:hypothetical protein